MGTKSTLNEIMKFTFEGQVFSVGLDVHKKSWTVTVVKDGMILKTFKIEPNVDKLLNSLNKNYPKGDFKFVYEAGFCGFWIQREITKRNYSCIVINPADVPSTQKEKVTKNDTVDSRKLARELDKPNSLRPLHIPTYEEESFRELHRYRLTLVEDQTRTKNRLKSFLNIHGIEIPEEFQGKKWSKKLITWMKEVEFSHNNSKIAFVKYIEDLEYLSKRIEKTTKEIEGVISKNKELNDRYKVIISAPGIGTICTIGLIAELWNIERFKKFDELCSYIGLIPTTNDSGDKSRSRGVTLRHKKKLRCLLIEAAWVAVRKDPVLLQRYGELINRMPANKAIIRIAKKLLRKIYYIWKKKETYVLAVA